MNTRIAQESYAEFYHQRSPSFFKKIFFSSTRNPILDTLTKHLQTIVNERELEGYDDNSIEKIIPDPNSTFIIWGNLQGAFHSLVRALDSLKKDGVIDNNCVITKPNHYFIFSSNVIIRSPYIIETLLTIIALIRANPGRVWYIRGLSEYKDMWHTDWLMDQLNGYATTDTSYLNKTLIPLLDRFFATLPYALYIGFQGNPPQWIGIGGDFKELEIDAEYTNGFFDNNATTYRINNKIPVENPVKIQAFLRSDKNTRAYNTKGLTQFDYEGGVTTWDLFSSPTSYNQENNKAFNDAFCVLAMNGSINNTTITLKYRDTRKSFPQFLYPNSYYLVSALRVNNTIRPHHQQNSQYFFGSTLDLSKSNALMGIHVRKGINLAISEYTIDEAHTKKDSFRIVMMDDEYTPLKARENIELLMKEGIDTFLIPTGSPTLQASLDLIQAGTILVLFPITGAPKFRSPELKGVIHLRASYRDEVYALMPYLKNKLDAKKYLIFYQDDAYGIGPLTAARELLPKLGIKEWKEVPYARNTTDFKAIIQTIKEFQPDALGLFSTSAPTKEMLRQVGVEYLVNTRLFGISFLVDDAFGSFVKALGLPYLFARSMPNPASSTLPIVSRYRELCDINNASYDIFSLEGYVGTRLLIATIESLKKSGQTTINATTLRAAFEQIKHYDFGGLTLNFNPETRELNNAVWLDAGEDDWTEWRDAEKRWKAEEAKATPSSIPT